jgi:hypothetical protein
VLELDLRIGDRLIRPTEHQENLGLAGLIGLGAGFLLGSPLLKVAGAVVLGSVAYSVWEDSAMFAQPEAMNAFFQTGGATSALGPAAPGPYDTAPSSTSLVSYAPPAAAAAAAGLADIGQQRGKRQPPWTVTPASRRRRR